MRVADLPLPERPRERLLQYGPQSLSDAELLAILLRTGRKGQSAIQLGHELLAHTGGLAGLLKREQRDIQQIKGLGPAKSAQLSAALELSRRCLMAELKKGDALTSPQQTRRYLQAELASEPNEVFAVLFLDTRHRIITLEKLFHGTIDGASVHPRVIVQRAMALNAAAIICSHNHPSGVAEPSSSDELLTRTLKEALALVDVRLLDHIIVTRQQAVSLAERGLL